MGVQVHLAGYDQESVLLVHPEDARLRRAVRSGAVTVDVWYCGA